MDFEGQKLAEKIYQYLIILFGIIGWIIGFYQQSFLITFYFVAAGTLLALIVCILEVEAVCLPDWSIFNKHALNWLKEEKKQSK